MIRMGQQQHSLAPCGALQQAALCKRCSSRFPASPGSRPNSSRCNLIMLQPDSAFSRTEPSLPCLFVHRHTAAVIRPASSSGSSRHQQPAAWTPHRHQQHPVSSNSCPRPSSSHQQHTAARAAAYVSGGSARAAAAGSMSPSFGPEGHSSARQCLLGCSNPGNMPAAVPPGRPWVVFPVAASS